MTIINDIINLMLEYQKNNNITKECITNAIYCCDQLNYNGYKSKVKAVIMTSINNEELSVCGGHLVIDIGNNQLIDASYETNSKPNQNYFDNINNLIAMYPSIKNDKELLSFTIKNFMNFIKIEKDINYYYKCIVSNKEHYNKQANYVEKKLRVILGT